MNKWILLLLLLKYDPALSQKQGLLLADSLSGQLKEANDEQKKAALYLKISDIFIDIDLNKAQLYADSGTRLANQIKWREGIARSEVNEGNICNFRGDYNQALQHIRKGYEWYRLLENKTEIGRALYAMGMSYERLSNYTEASDCYFKSLHIFESLPGNDHQTGNSLSAIAVIYFIQKDFKKSLEYSRKALQKQELSNNTVGVANELMEMADTYYELHDSSNALLFNRKALDAFARLGDNAGQATVYYQLGKVHGKNDSLALGYLFKAKKIFDDMSDSSNTAYMTLGEIGRIYLRMLQRDDVLKSTVSAGELPGTAKEMTQKAETYLQKALTESKKAGDLDNESEFSADLARLQFREGNYKNAFLNYKLFHETRDSIFSQDSKNKIASLESQREISLKNKEIENKELLISNQNKKMGLLLSGIAFLIIIGLLLYRQNRISKNVNDKLNRLNQELAEANQIKAKFFGILSHDLRSPLASLINFIELQRRKPGLMNERQITERENRIAGSARDLMETMETVLLWSKGQMNQYEPDISSFSARELFSGLKKYISETTDVRFTYADPQNLIIHSDIHCLQTILYNLTANAVKALKNTKDPEIIWKAWSEEGRSCLSITDNGPGIKPEQLSALYQAGAGSGSKNGLGLQIIRDLAKTIDCRISQPEQKSQGTTFILSLKN